VHHLLRKANDHRFGARNERLERLPADHLRLALEDIEASLAKNEAIEEKKPRLPGAGTRKARRVAQTSAAHRRNGGAAEHQMPVSAMRRRK
jgi:hypothetical protein